MAAYAALVSLMYIIEQIKHHPRPPISLDKNQAESLCEKVIFLQNFLEGYSFHGDNEEADGLLSRIAVAACAAEDKIESHVVDQILARSTSTTHGENISSIDFYQSLQKVIEDMEFIMKEVMEIQEKMRIQDQLHRNSIPVADSLRSPSTGQNTILVFDDVLTPLKEKLTRQPANRQIIPIVGMGGIGKTTLAKTVYSDLFVVETFDICAWVTISQEYSVQEILIELVSQITQISKETLREKSENDLGVQLYKSLWGRRYLIVMDDIWSIEAWDKVKSVFPDNNNGSRIMITTRLSGMALGVSGSNSSDLKMNLLDKDKSWELFCKNVLGEEKCPLELEEIGKEIVENCKGLPLSIVVIGGLLAKSKRTREYWEYIAKNLNSIVNLEDNDRCLKIMRMSYNQLPVHLKSCFLYMGVFREDVVIRSSTLINQWVAEGFLKPVNGKTLKEIAKGCLKDFVDRNLILVHKRGITGNIKSFKIHDLVRDLCLREAKKEKFLCVIKNQCLNIPQGNMNTQHRIGIHQNATLEEKQLSQLFDDVKFTSLACSSIFDFFRVLPSLNFGLLRTLRVVDRAFLYDGVEHSGEAIFQLVNSRHLKITSYTAPDFTFPSLACSLLWNLHTLIVEGMMGNIIAPVEIWKMPQLRHVEVDSLYLPDLPCDQLEGGEDYVLENLQTLLGIRDLKFRDEVVEKIPNIKKLEISYPRFDEGSGSYYCLSNLGRLHKLESLYCSFDMEERARQRNDLPQNLIFPHSLKKLTLEGCHLQWEDMTTKIGLLPFLQVLRVRCHAFIGSKWETVENQFPNLKILQISMCVNLEDWITDYTHFPRLERLVLHRLNKLKAIPWGIGEIPTLHSIELDTCTDSAIISAKKIVEEQAELGNADLRVRVWHKKNQEAKGLASHNFQVIEGIDLHDFIFSFDRAQI